MLTLVLCAFAHGSRTWAGDALTLSDPWLAAPKPNAPSLPDAPLSVGVPVLPRALLDSPRIAPPLSEDDFSATEFRPRKHDANSAAKLNYGSGDPMFRTTTVWQRLNEFRAQDRVRLLTLWEMGGSNLSIQAGKKGDPSLQWSSSWTNRSRVTHGLLDRVLAASLSGMANRANASHYSPASSSVAPKPLLTAVPSASSK